MNEFTTQTLDRIIRVVNWYAGVPADFRDIDLLTNASRVISCLLFAYAGEVGDLYKMAKGSEYARKAAFEKERLRLIVEGKSVAAAESEAKVCVDKLAFEETCADSDFRSAQMQLSAARDVSESIRQHIASLKTEKRLEMAGAAIQQ